MTKEIKTKDKISIFKRIFGVKPASVRSAIKDLNDMQFLEDKSPVSAVLKSANACFFDSAEEYQNKDSYFNKTGGSSPLQKEIITNRAYLLHSTYKSGKPILFSTLSNTLMCFWGKNFSATYLNAPFFGKGSFVSNVYAIKDNKEVTSQHLSKFISARTRQETDKAIKSSDLVELDKKGKPIVEASFNTPILGDKALHQGGHQLLLESLAPMQYMSEIERRKPLPSKNDLIQDAWKVKLKKEDSIKKGIWAELSTKLLKLKLLDLKKLGKGYEADKERQKLEKEVIKIESAMENVINKTIDKYTEPSNFNPGAVFFDSNFIVQGLVALCGKPQPKLARKTVDTHEDEIFFDDPEMNSNKLIKKEEKKQQADIRQQIYNLFASILSVRDSQDPLVKRYAESRVTLIKNGKSQEVTLSEGLVKVDKMGRSGEMGERLIAVTIQEGSITMQMPPIDWYYATNGALLAYCLYDQRIKQGQKPPPGFSLQFNQFATDKNISISAITPEPDNNPRLD